MLVAGFGERDRVSTAREVIVKNAPFRDDHFHLAGLLHGVELSRDESDNAGAFKNVGE